jgi:hypothetical protein
MFQLARLMEHAGPEVAADFGRSLGAEIGRRIAEKLKNASGIDAWTEHLGGHLALLGLGSLTLERWGKALVLRVTGAPEGATALIGSVFEGALQRGLGEVVATVAFDAEHSTGYLVVSPGTAERVRGMAAAGEGLGQIVEQLHKGAA